MTFAPGSPAERLYVITDRESANRGIGSVEAAVEGALEAGARMLQFRDKHEPAGASLELGGRLADRCADAGARMLVNGRADLAACLNADGVHRPASGLPVECLREVVGEEELIGASTHGRGELREAEESGADFATVSPVFRSASKPDYGPPLGPEGLGELVEEVDLPVFALAGIESERVEACLQAGAVGVAVMSGIMAADDPRVATEHYLDAIAAAS